MKFYALACLVAVGSSMKVSTLIKQTPAAPKNNILLELKAKDQCDAIKDLVAACRDDTKEGQSMDFGEFAMNIYETVMEHYPKMLTGPNGKEFAQGMMNWAYEAFTEADTNGDHQVSSEELEAELDKHADDVNC